MRQYARGSENVLAAGFDGVEIHAANGDLLDQFINSSTNRRADSYGGPIQNRARLLIEVVDSVSKVWGSKRVECDCHLWAHLTDLIAFGRKFLADPDLPKRFRQRAALNAERPVHLLWRPQSYTDYQTLAQELGEEPKPCLDDRWR